MKEFEEKPQHDKEVAVHAQHKTHKHIGTTRAVRGLTLYEHNPATGSIVPAQFEEVVDITTKACVKKVIIKENHVYLQALNVKNAARKLAKI